MSLKSLILFLYLLCASSFGQWSQEARDVHSQYDHPFRDEVMTTVWGNIVPVQYVSKSKFKIKTKELRVNADIRLEKTLRYNYHYAKSWKQEKRPLLVFIPGIFAPITSYQASDMTRRFINLGYRVITFSNPLGKEYLEADPQHELLDLKAQSKIYSVAIRKVMRSLEEQNLYNGHAVLGGVSYGSLVAAMIYNDDQKRSTPVLNELLVMGPPMNLIKSAQRLDMYVEQAKDMTFFDGASAIASYFHLRYMKERSDVTYETLMMAREALTQESFIKGLARSIKIYDEVNTLKIVPKKSKKEKAWKKSLRFISTFENLSPKAYQQMLTTQVAILAPYILEAKKNIAGKPNKKILILSAQDDVINNRIDPRLLLLPEMMALPYGGHYGFQCLKWFDRLITAQFKL
tara:strand:- start:126123 stop:127331 length:1209 start_codon:yes stop_codon:yes gene_type:complete